MKNRNAKRNKYFEAHKKHLNDQTYRRTPEEQAWLDMRPVGLEFGSDECPDSLTYDKARDKR